MKQVAAAQELPNKALHPTRPSVALLWPVAVWRRSVLRFGASAALSRAGERRSVGPQPMTLETTLVTALLFLAAISSARRAGRLACWVPVDAEVVNVDLVGPFGLSPQRFTHQLELQRRGQGAMGPEIVYYAELVYVVDGIPHRAELTFDGPPDRKVALRFNPANPSENTTSHPHYAPSIGLALLGFASLLYFCF
jgi:hypothetical protein